jgi:hypothetical protein
MEFTEKDRLEILQKQLERMRGMLYGYYSQFFTAVHLFTVLVLAIITLSLFRELRPLILALPFFIVYAGCFCAFLMSYNIFARVYASALEQKINSMVGQNLLVSSPMEDMYIYKTNAPKFVAIDFATPNTALSAVTFQYLFSGLVIFIIGVYRSWQILPYYTQRFAILSIYWEILGFFTVTAAIYLMWFFIGAGPERKIATFVSKAYGEAQTKA